MKVTVKPVEIRVHTKTQKIYPELEDLEITPTVEEQNFKSEKYGYDNVKVKAVESEELTIIPNIETQINEGMFYKVTVQGDENLVPENISENKTIFGVEGKAKTVNLKITDCSYLFYGGVRTDYLQEILSLCEKPKSARSMFQNCLNLTDVDLSNLDLGDTDNVLLMFSNCSKLKNIQSFKNLGKGYTRQTENYSNYTLGLGSASNINYESLIDILINGLYDLNLTYDVANGGTLYKQTIDLGSSNLRKLQETEEGLQAIAIATNKGWNVT